MFRSAHLHAITSNLSSFGAETAGLREQSRTVVSWVYCEIHRHVRILLAPSRVRQPKGLMQTPQQKGSIRSQEATPFDIPSKVRPHTVSPSTLLRLLLS